MNWQNTFLGRLYAEQRKVLIIIVFLLSAQAFFMYKKIDSLPFFNYGMYSARAEVWKESPVFVLRIEGDTTDFDYQLLPQLARDMLQNNLAFYYGLHRHGLQQEAGLRATIQNRFGSFLSPAQMQYCERQLCNPPHADADKMRAWLIRFLQPYREQQINNIRFSVLILSPLPQGFIRLDSVAIF
jgi:hypothetical protein